MTKSLKMIEKKTKRNLRGIKKMKRKRRKPTKLMIKMNKTTRLLNQRITKKMKVKMTIEGL